MKLNHCPYIGLLKVKHILWIRGYSWICESYKNALESESELEWNKEKKCWKQNWKEIFFTGIGMGITKHAEDSVKVLH